MARSSLEEKALLLAIRSIAAEDGRYDPQAFTLVIDGLNISVDGLDVRRHVSAAELLQGIRELASARFGPMTRVVLEDWSVTSTRDFGEIVYLLIDAGILSADENDSIEDFNDVFDFVDVFD